MVPVDEVRRFGRKFDHARQVDRRTLVDVHVRPAENVCVRFDNFEANKVRYWRSGRDLALIDAGISDLHIFDLEDPVVGVVHMQSSESLVRSVGVSPNRQQVDVPVTNPRHRKVLDVVDAAVEDGCGASECRDVCRVAGVELGGGGWGYCPPMDIHVGSVSTADVAVSCNEEVNSDEDEDPQRIRAGPTAGRGRGVGGYVGHVHALLCRDGQPLHLSRLT